MLALKQRKCDSWNKNSCIANIVFPQTEAGKKYCLSRGLQIDEGWPEPGKKYNINVSFITKWFEQTKKFSSFGKGTAQWMFCIPLNWNHLFLAFAARILWKLNTWIFLQERVQPNAWQVATIRVPWKMITVFCFWNWNWHFSSPRYITYFIRQNLQIFTEKVPFSGISWKNIHFKGLKK